MQADFPLTVAESLANLRRTRPMVHHITNDVVTNFTANVTLCLGAAPVMAPAIEESAEMAVFAGALLLNIGTLNPGLIESMLAAGRAAEAKGIPVVLDPVGAGATALRTDSCRRLLRELRIPILRGNAGEVLSLAGAGGKVRGVDSMDTGGSPEEALAAYAARTRRVVGITGVVDIVTDGQRIARVHNGHPMMGSVTGTGCAAGTAVAAFAAVVPDPFIATTAALAAFGVAGEIAAEASRGPGSFVPNFLDALYNLDGDHLRERVRVEILQR